MAAWEDYRPCCGLAASHDRQATFCPDCGHPLWRCTAPDCGTLVTPLGHCPSCIDLALYLEKGAVLRARVGDCSSVPFVLRNNAATRAVSIRKILREGTNVPQEAVTLAWEVLEAGRSRACAVTTGPFAHAGVHNLRLTLVVSAVFDDLEETYAFTSDVAIDVEGRDPTQVVQHFNLAGADFGTAGMVVANPHASVTDRGRHADKLEARTAVVLERAERFEIEQGYRGYAKDGLRVPRDVEFSFAGFPPADAPPPGPLRTRPMLRCGRNGRPGEGRHTTEPNDLCLRAYDPATGALDREASAAISRHVCDFVLQNQRLHVRVSGAAGVAVNGEPLAAGDAREVVSGDAFSLAAGPARTLAFGVGFKTSGGLVTRVMVEKHS